MNNGKTIFSQLMEFIPLYEFNKCVARYHGDARIKNFSCMNQFLCMAFAQLTYRESLRDIASCLGSMKIRLYHMGFRGKISKSTLADANEKRDWRIYADFAQVLISRARRLYLDEPLGMELKDTVYALDATTIDLCLSLFPWARFRKHKAAVKLHTLLDLKGPIPSFIEITEGKIHDVNVLDSLVPEPGSFYVMDRGYLDFERLYRMHQSQAFFVIRAKSNMKYRRLYSQPVDKQTGLRCTQTIMLTNYYSTNEYPEKLRLIRFVDAEGRRLAFLTNYFSSGRFNRSGPLQITLEDRAFFGVDQTTSSYQDVLRYFSQCSQDSDLDRHIHLRPCGDCQERTEAKKISLHNFTDFERHHIRESAVISSTYRNECQRTTMRISQPVDIVQLITGQ